MATLTVTIDPAVLEAAEREADRRQTTLDEFIVGSSSNILAPRRPTISATQNSSS